MPILYLLFGHLVADFVLQPEKLVKWKYKSWKGMLLHGGVHLGVNLILFWLFMPNITVILALLTLAAAHFLIDSLKIRQEELGSKYGKYFLIDQVFHLITIIGIGMLLNDFRPVARVEGAYIVSGLTLLIFFTYAVEIFSYQKVREKNKTASFKPNYRSMLKRALIITALYALFMIFTVYRVAAFI
jgi:hypothetical protein